MSTPQLTVRSMRAVPVMSPMTYVLGTSAGAVRTAPLLLFDLETEEGITGRAYQFCYTPAAAQPLVLFLNDMLEAIRGEAVAPTELRTRLTRRYTLIGVQGVVRMGMSLVDVAAWDALSQAAGMPLATFLGGAPGAVQAYNSNGLGLMPTAALADEAEKLIAGGFRAVKLRLGYPKLEEDLAAVRAVRARIADDVALMVDYNQALTVAEAVKRGRVLDGGWREAGALAHASGLPMSSHLYPEASAHLLAATPGAHWLEYVDWLNAIVEEPLRIDNGMARPSDRPGIGLAWNEEVVRKLAVS